MFKDKKYNPSVKFFTVPYLFSNNNFTYRKPKLFKYTDTNY